LGVTVPAFALPEEARPASPAAWYTTVTRGRIERFMPPFVSLNDQERWDVVAYIMSMHTSEDEIQKGREAFEANCSGCSIDYFKDLNRMSSLSTVALARIVRLGNEDIPAFGENLPDDEMWAVAEYLRSLTYDTAPIAAAPTIASNTETPAPADAGTPSAETTPIGTEQVEAPDDSTSPPEEGFGTVSGSIDNKTGKALSSDLTVTLRGYEHDLQDPNAGPVEVVTLEGEVSSDGSFTFENVEMPEGRIFIADVTNKGIENTSDFMVVEAGQSSLTLPPLVLNDVTQDTAGLIIDELDLFLTASDNGTYELLALYSFRNTGESVVQVEMEASQEIPFLRFPTGAQPLGYEALQDSAPFTSTTNGFAMSPSDTPYGIIAFSSIAREQEFTLEQPIDLPVSIVRVFLPEGLEAQGDQITQDSPQDIQGETYQAYFTSELAAGDILSLQISGTPNPGAAQPEATTPNSALLVGAGGLGIALLLAGAWMYMRDKTVVYDEDDDDGEGEFESTEEVMDAIIALDDLHRAKKISKDAYQKRRAELKEILKEMV
jgi:mono/diheme cytochrome c family protein